MGKIDLTIEGTHRISKKKAEALMWALFERLEKLGFKDVEVVIEEKNYCLAV